MQTLRVRRRVARSGNFGLAISRDSANATSLSPRAVLPAGCHCLQGRGFAYDSRDRPTGQWHGSDGVIEGRRPGRLDREHPPRQRRKPSALEALVDVDDFDTDPATWRQDSKRKRLPRSWRKLPGDPAYQPVARALWADSPGTSSSSGSTPRAQPGELVAECFEAKASSGLAEADFKFVFSEPMKVGMGRKGGTARSTPNDSAAGLQARITAAKSAGHVLELVSAHLNEMDPMHAATALHRLARHGPKRRREAEMLGRDPRVQALLARLDRPDACEGLSLQGRTCALLAMARLGLAAPCLPRLAAACVQGAADFSSHQLATALHALSKLEALPVMEPHLLLEALHEELRRRSASLGPGGTSAMDAVLIADALARLQVRDDMLFSALAEALLRHLDAGNLGVRELRHVLTAFASIGFTDSNLCRAACLWLVPRVGVCSGSDLVTLTYALARSGETSPGVTEFFLACIPHVLTQLHKGNLGGRDACSLLFSFSQVHALSGELASELSDAVGRAPDALNGQDLALVVPCLSAAGQRPRPQVLQALADRAVRCSATLSPRQLARLMVGFGDAGAKIPNLWDTLGREAMMRVRQFSVPDVLRVLAGLDAMGAQPTRVIQAFWAQVAAKSGKYMAEESLVLLRMWPRIAEHVRRDNFSLPAELKQNMVMRLERSGRWQGAPEFGLELIEWLPQSRDLAQGQLDQRLVKAALGHLPSQIMQMKMQLWMRLLGALALSEEEVASAARAQIQRRSSLRNAFEERMKHVNATACPPAVGASMAFRCAALGYDGAAMHELLRALLAALSGNVLEGNVEQVAQLCWACAEIRAFPQEALQLSESLAQARHMQSVAGFDTLSAVHWIRLAWSTLVLAGPPGTVRAFADLASAVEGEELLALLTPADVLPARQLAWHYQRQAGTSGRWAEFLLSQRPAARVPISASPRAGVRGGQGSADERQISAMLQEMRVPHVASSQAAVPGGMYRVPVWFPQSKAVLDIGDTLASGSPGGAADLRRQQLLASGLVVYSLDLVSMRKLPHAQQLRVVAQAIAESCPEAVEWLQHADVGAQSDSQREQASQS